MAKNFITTTGKTFWNTVDHKIIVVGLSVSEMKKIMFYFVVTMSEIPPALSALFCSWNAHKSIPVSPNCILSLKNGSLYSHTHRIVLQANLKAFPLAWLSVTAVMFHRSSYWILTWNQHGEYSMVTVSLDWKYHICAVNQTEQITQKNYIRPFQSIL